MARIRAGLKFNIGKHGRIYIPLGGGSKKKRSSSKGTPVAHSSAASVRPSGSGVVDPEPSIGVAVVTGLMSLLLLLGLFFAIVAVGAFARHSGAGDILGGIICTAIALAGLFFGGIGLWIFISNVKGLKEKKTRKKQEKETADLADQGLEKTAQYSFYLQPNEAESVQARLRKWKLYGGTIELKLRSNDETGAVSFDYLEETIGHPDETTRAWITLSSQNHNERLP